MDFQVGFDAAAAAERERCVALIVRHAKRFEQKRLYNTARAMRDLLNAIQGSEALPVED